MKTRPLPFQSLLVPITLGLLVSTGCSRQEREKARAEAEETYAEASAKVKETYAEASGKVKDAYAETKAAVAEAWDEVRSFSFDQREKFAGTAKAMQAEMEAKASRLRAELSEEQAGASRRAAMAELKNAEADYRQKVAALGDASAATWESAKLNVIAAWDRLQAAYHKAKGD